MMSNIMSDHYLLNDIMEKLKHDISIEVDFGFLKPYLVPILTTPNLQRAKCRQTNYSKMIQTCEICANLSMPDFVRFTAALKVDYQHVFDKINNEYRIRTGRDLPAVQQITSNAVESPGPRYPVAIVASQSGGLTASQAGSSRYLASEPMEPNLASSERTEPNLASSEPMEPNLASSEPTEPNLASSAPMEPNLASSEPTEPNLASSEPMETNLASSEPLETNLAPRIRYTSFGPAVPCTSDEIASVPAFPNSSAELPHYTVGSSQALPENVTPSTNQHPICDLSSTSGENHDQAGAAAAMMTKYEKKFKEEPTDVYKMDSIPRGRCLIINNEQFKHLRSRNGSLADNDNLYKMFTYLGFDVSQHKNKTAKEMLDLLNKFAKSSNFEDVSAMAVVILSHGGINDCIFGSDGAVQNKIPVEGTFIKKFDLQQMFISRKCPLLEGKPKLFILQACRGDEEDKYDRSQDSSFSPDDFQNRENQSIASQDGSDESSTASDGPSQGMVTTAETADMCFLHSASLGYKAYRNVALGSPFVQHFTEEVVRSAHEKSFYDIFRKVQKVFSTKMIGSTIMTMPDYTAYLTKKWYLNPPAQSS